MCACVTVCLLVCVYVAFVCGGMCSEVVGRSCVVCGLTLFSDSVRQLWSNRERQGKRVLVD